MDFKRADQRHAGQIIGIIEKAQILLKEKGIDQWQNNYPNIDTIVNDIRNENSYILLKDNVIVGTAAIIFGPDETYHKIYNGKWLTNGAYGVIHRIAIDPQYQGLGLASIIIKRAEEMCQDKKAESIKIDTHRENKSMIDLLLKNGFKYCGIIYLADGNERIAFEKIVQG